MSRPPLAASPLPRRRPTPRSRAAATSASAVALTTDARTLDISASGIVRELSEEVFGHGHPEDGVAEELQPLVRFVARVLRAPRPMREREGQRVGLGEGVSDSLGKR